MFANILVIFSTLFLLTSAELRVRFSGANLRMSKEQQTKAVASVQNHLDGLTQKAHAKGKKEVHDQIKKSMKLQEWNDYDSDYNSEFWYNAYFYGEASCGGNVVYQASMYESYCWVGEITSSTNMKYSSVQILFKSDCSSKTAVFYTSDDCSGEPAKQGNTESQYTMDQCVATVDDDDDNILVSESGKVMCESSAAGWSGNGGALKLSMYEQTDTCAGSPEAYIYISGGCYKMGTSESVLYGNPTVYYPSSDDCTGVGFDQTIDSSCDIADDDDSYYGEEDDDDAGLIDDGMFTNIDMNDDVSQNMMWIDGSSMGAVLNYSLSVALLIMSPSLFF